MKSEEFTQRVRKAVYEPSVQSTLGVLQKPPGRKPSESLVALSQWFNQLPDDERKRVEGVIQLATRQAVFGMLTVLDGVRSINEADEEGRLELHYIDAGQPTLLNDPEAVPMHDLFAEQVPPP